MDGILPHYVFNIGVAASDHASLSYEVGKVIGTGKFSEVKLGRDRRTNTQVRERKQRAQTHACTQALKHTCALCNAQPSWNAHRLQVAVKVIKKKQFALNPMWSMEAMRSEVVLLQAVDHPNIVKIHDVYETEENLNIVLELLREGDLFDVLVKHKRFDEATSRRMMWQIASALEYLHSAGVLARSHYCALASLHPCTPQ